MMSGAPLQHEAIPVPIDLKTDVEYWYLKRVRDKESNETKIDKVGPFKVVGSGRNFRTHQEMVALGRDGSWAPLWFVTLIDFASNFEKREGI